MTTKDRFGSVDTIFYTITDFKPFVDLEIEDYSVIVFEVLNLII